MGKTQQKIVRAKYLSLKTAKPSNKRYFCYCCYEERIFIYDKIIGHTVCSYCGWHKVPYIWDKIKEEVE